MVRLRKRLRSFGAVYRISLRDAAGSGGRLSAYGASLVLGIAAVVLALALRDSISAIMDAEAKVLLGADLALQSKDPIEESVTAHISPDESADEIRFRSMVTFDNGEARLAQVRAIAGGYPFYGEIETDPPKIWNEVLTGAEGVLVDEALILQTKSGLGKVVKIGKASFVIRGIVKKIPGSTVFNTAVSPRIYMARGNVDKTALLSDISVADYFRYLKLPPDRVESAQKVLPQLSTNINLDTVEDRRRRLGSVNDNALLYFSLAGLACLALGAIGTSSSLYFYLRSKLPDAAILKCLGFKSSKVLSIYLLQLLFVSIAASLCGSLLGGALYYALLPQLADLFSSPLVAALPWSPLLYGVVLGATTIILAALPGLIVLKRTPALHLMRGDAAAELTIPEKSLLFFLALIAAPAVLLFVSDSIIRAFFYGAALNLTVILIYGCARMIRPAIRKVAKLKLPYPIRYGLLSLCRPQNSTTPLTTAFSFAFIFAALLLITRHFLVKQVMVAKSSATANLFIYDVGREDLREVRAILDRHQLQVEEVVPIVLMRIKKVDDRNSTDILQDGNSAIPHWTLRRDYWTTYRSHRLNNEELISGTWIEKKDPSDKVIPISLDLKMAERLGISLNDTLTFDVQGIELETIVASLRKIRWEQMQRNAFVVFPEGVLEDAPQFLFVTAFAPDPAASAAVQRDLAAAFPGVSVVDIRTVVESIFEVFDKIAVALAALSVVVLLTALVVLFATILSSKDARRAEARLLRVLGATSSQLRAISFTEYFSLGLVSSLVGLAISLLAGYLMALYLFKTDFTVPWFQLSLLAAGSILCISLVSRRSAR